MEHTEAEYKALLSRAFPEPIMKALLRGVVDGYSATPSACKRALDKPDRHDGFGTIRRGKVNELVRGVCDRHELRYKDEPNSAGSTYFLSVFSGRIRLCAQLLSLRSSRIPNAEIRKMWAAHNRDGRNGELFDTGEPSVPLDAVYCAFLVHSPRRNRRDQPAFVDIVIPDKSLKRFILTVNLYQLFPEVALEVGNAQEPKRAQPKPRKLTRRKDEGA